MSPAPQPSHIDHLIDDLLRLQARYPALIWRLKERYGVEIEFFLEELAIDCAAALKQARIPAQHLPGQPRLVHLPENALASGGHTKIIRELETFLQAHSQADIHTEKEQAHDSQLQ